MTAPPKDAAAAAVAAAFDLYGRGGPRKAAALLRHTRDAALASGQAIDDRQFAAALQVFEAMELVIHGRYEIALAGIRTPLQVLESGPHAGDLALVLSGIGFALGQLGDPASGLQWVARAAALARASGRLIEGLKTRSDEGCLLAMLQRYERAIEILTEASTLAQKTAPRFAQAGCLSNLACAWVLRAQWQAEQGAVDRAHAWAERAVHWSARALQAASAAGEPAAAAASRAYRAQGLLILGRLDDAEADLLQAQADCGGFKQLQVEVLRGLVGLHRRRGNFEAARACWQRAFELCEGEAYEPLRVPLLEDAVRLETEAGEHRLALGCWVRHFAAVQSRYERRLRLRGADGPLDVSLPPRWPDPRLPAAESQDQADWLDADTGLLNLHGLEQVAQAAFEQSPGLPLAVLQLDVAAPDAAALGRVAAVLAAAWPSGFVAARGLADRFVLLFPDLPPPAAHALCERLRHAISGSANPSANDAKLTASLGLAVRHTAPDLSSLLADAVLALEQAIAQGGNQTVLHPSAPSR